jgi:hypothetical protein
MYPQGDAPGSWPQYNQQPYPQDPYQQPTQPLPPPYGYPSQPMPGPGIPGPGMNGMPGQRPRSKGPLIIVGAVLGVLVLICALGIVTARLLLTADDDAGAERADPPPAVSASEEPTSPPETPEDPEDTADPTEESVEGDLARFKAGDCLTITGPENTVNPAACTASGAYKVLLRRDGTTDEKVCDSTEATEILYQDGAGTSKDLVLCVVEVT